MDRYCMCEERQRQRCEEDRHISAETHLSRDCALDRRCETHSLQQSALLHLRPGLLNGPCCSSYGA